MTANDYKPVLAYWFTADEKLNNTVRWKNEHYFYLNS